MEKSNYLPIGFKLGGHYEIIKQLGDNNVSILYLVKDTHRRETLFVLKELFLNDISYREGTEVYSKENSKHLFESQKKETISSVNLSQKAKKEEDFEIYGYFKENNTIYTIMEFINESSNIERYFMEKKQEIELPPIPTKEPKATPPKKKKSFLFLKLLLLFVIILAGLFFYSYKMIQEDKARAKEKKENSVRVIVKEHIHHPPLAEKKDEPQTPTTINITNNEINNSILNTPETNTTDENNSSYIENNSTIKSIEEIPINRSFDEVSVKNFLDKIVTLSINGSVDKLVSYYDAEVDRYFSLSNVTHETIYNDRVNYNKKWVNREFTILDFQILKAYRKGDSEYCDIKSTTHWNVSTEDFEKTASGVSTDFITLKKTAKGYKLKSIYTLK